MIHEKYFEMKKAQEEWNGPIVVIINGEYYDLVKEEEKK